MYTSFSLSFLVEFNHLKIFFGALAIVAFAHWGVDAQEAQINICENVTDNIFVTDISNCSNYFICVNGQPIPQQCDGGRFFNGVTQSCDVTNAACLQQKCGDNDLFFTQYPRTCNKYVMCFAGDLIIRECADNLQFNSATNVCDLPSNVDCVSNHCPIQNNPQDIIYIPSAADCTKYYICLSGTPQANTCAKGLQFSTACNCCDLQSKVNCKITPLSRRSVFNYIAPPQMVDIDCPQNGIHFYPHKNANRYYVCSEGKGALLSCAEGLFYDPESQECRQLQKFRFN